jgi:Flp pilus assembly protein TadG
MKLRTEDGAAAIEFALVLPILLLLVFGIIEFGFALYNKEVITNASREGARYGIIMACPTRPTASQIQNVVTTYLSKMPLVGWNASKATTTVTGAGAACGTGSGSDLTVMVNYPYSFLVLQNLIPGFNKSITLSAQTLMKLE